MKQASIFAQIPLLLGLAVVTCGAPAAEFYKWLDKDGNTVYSRTPPPADIKTEVVKATTRVDSEAANREIQGVIKQTDDLNKAREKKAEDQQKSADEIAMREENCQRARSRLSSYSVPNARIIQEDGSQIRPDEETRLKMLKQAQDWIDQWCQ